MIRVLLCRFCRWRARVARWETARAESEIQTAIAMRSPELMARSLRRREAARDRRETWSRAAERLAA